MCKHPDINKIRPILANFQFFWLTSLPQGNIHDYMNVNQKKSNQLIAHNKKRYIIYLQQ